MIFEGSTSVRAERNGWRDEKLSRRHRLYGLDCPALDLDFLLCEYDHGIVKAIVEYKHERAAPQRASHPSYRALNYLARGDRPDIPLLVARYTTEDFAGLRVPLNGQARVILPERTRMSEHEWVELLYRLRDRSIPSGIFDRNGNLLTQE